MSILGTLVGRHSHSFAFGETDGVFLTTFAHSLPATNPEFILPQVKSVQAVAGNGSNGVPGIICLGGNASLATVGYAMASALSVPIMAVDFRYEVVHTAVR